ncbi:MAG: response regulator [Acidobacteria bacterium]|nr:response regulator [Acidobacteriota bacterium]
MPPKQRRHRPLVMVIDESRHTRNALRFYLSNAGYDVEEAANNHAAVERAAGDAPDLILIDLNMPGSSGVLATQRLRGAPLLSGVPVVACAGPDSQAYRDAARVAGADAYVTKPFNPAVLLPVVKSLLNRGRMGVLPSSDVTQLATMVL